MGVRPPNIRSIWEENDVWTQAMMMGYNQIRSVEETTEQYKFLSDLFKAIKATG